MDSLLKLLTSCSMAFRISLLVVVFFRFGFSFIWLCETIPGSCQLFSAPHVKIVISYRIIYNVARMKTADQR